jgi:membrane-anchored protein YejM (alkaline phosphatase superfamily)
MIPQNIRKAVSFPPFWADIVPIVFFNTLISMVISFPLLKSMSPEGPVYYMLLDLITFGSHYFLINCALGLILYLFSVFLPDKVVTTGKIGFYFLLQIFLIVDTKVYSLFHFHINSLVWNVLTTEGAGDSVFYGKNTIITFLCIALILLLIEIFIIVKVNFFIHKISGQKRLALMKALKIVFIAGLLMIFVDKGFYAYADIVNDTRITKNIKLYPLYQPLTIKRFARKVLGIKINREVNFKMKGGHDSIVYPKASLTFDPALDRRFNIVIIVVEGLRFDMLDEEIMPNIVRFGRRNMVFNNHYSGGNGSRFGVFSLLYGIHGSYWHNFLSRRISPVLIDTLIDKKYDFKILSSTKLTFPEFRKTAFIRIPDKIEDEFTTSDMTERDRLITENLIDYVSGNGSQKPFFAFLFYNSSHQMYKYPAEFEKFRPVMEKKDINYFLDSGSDKADMIRNRYKNAVHYEDHLIGDIIKALEDKDLMKKTILVVTGDHGEEFFENGNFGHTSSFNDYQTKTVFVMHSPGENVRTVNRITSHVDVVPTLMDSLGCVSGTDLYTQGQSLTNDTMRSYVSAASWDRAAIIDDEVKIIFSTELYNMGMFEVRRSEDYDRVENQKEILKQKKIYLVDMIEKMSEYYK